MVPEINFFPPSDSRVKKNLDISYHSCQCHFMCYCSLLCFINMILVLILFQKEKIKALRDVRAHRAEAHVMKSKVKSRTDTHCHLNEGFQCFKAVLLSILSGPLELEFNQTETEERGQRARCRLIQVPSWTFNRLLWEYSIFMPVFLLTVNGESPSPSQQSSNAADRQQPARQCE